MTEGFLCFPLLHTISEMTTVVCCKYSIGEIIGIRILHVGIDTWEMSYMTILDLHSNRLHRITCAPSCWFDDDGHAGGVESRDLPIDD